ncbi:capsular polysaccharide biosynthesis protein [Lutibacter sp. Hel_I_33_5]|uniref:capsular polysaccharide export protein, LipB/KpsS family n=1 Tax=Lutibacter sp. Hel_I_33_5 TaxID=1566289 RepID=UPI0011A2B8C7|nr:hypothetical protein [Lutibacter sp. Hel_I_33_5]TVZ56191.1 capsular polysaccharide biosynthesis protein [Lutibacter sp. Hel_I_33_5]
MTIVFIENRYKTFLYEPIALELKKLGYKIHWLIQNKEFSPKSNEFENHVLPFPEKGSVEKNDPLIEEIIKIDRQQNHFNKKEKSYFYFYDKKIEQILNEIKPNFIFGEATVFHELLTIKYCQEKQILFLNPSSCRYPVGRFSFYLNDTLIPYLGSNEILEDKEAEKIVNSIIQRSIIPNYMNPLKVNKIGIVYDKYLKVKSYVRGERYNTPNPIVKFLKEKKRKTKITNWNSKSVTKINEKDKKFKVLYPLQMQPESSIDVYGKDFIDQTNLIKEIYKSLPENCELFIKPNPKSNLELTQELLDFVESENNVIHLHHLSKMEDVLSKVDLVVTVTGTVAIECILSNVPIITLVESINDYCQNCKYISSISEIPKVIKTILNETFPIIDMNKKVNFINELNKTSFKGIVSDPFSDPNCINESNIEDLLIAFKIILDSRNNNPI